MNKCPENDDVKMSAEDLAALRLQAVKYLENFKTDFPDKAFEIDEIIKNIDNIDDPELLTHIITSKANERMQVHTEAVFPKALELTPDGERMVMSNGVVTDLPEVNIIDMPPGFKPKHRKAMMEIAAFLAEMKRQAPNRKVPMTRNELIEWGIPKTDISALERLGFVKQRITPLLDKSGESVGSRAVVYFTPIGKAWLKREFPDG